MRDFRDGILLKLLETRLYFGMKIKIGLLLCFTFLEKINNNKTSPYRFPTKLIAVGGRFQLADANELELKHRIFLSPPLVKMNIISPRLLHFMA
jgi:hypothetical protein